MNFPKTNRHTLLLSLSLLIITACSSKQEVISVSEEHLYNNNYGIVQEPDANAMLNDEHIAMQSQEIEDNNEKFSPPAGTFLAEDYVQPPEKITYKYQFDPKFYSKAEWRKMP